jgi:hypothetical protein
MVDQTLPQEPAKKKAPFPLRGKVRMGMGFTGGLHPIPTPALPLKGRGYFEMKCFRGQGLYPSWLTAKYRA